MAVVIVPAALRLGVVDRLDIARGKLGVPHRELVDRTAEIRRIAPSTRCIAAGAPPR
jgi:hypothetical protein